MGVARMTGALKSHVASRCLSAAFFIGLLSGTFAYASPWAEVGDAQLRSDINVLAAAGLIDNITSQWPLPWNGVLNRLGSADIASQPAYVRNAANRVRRLGMQQTRTGSNFGTSVDIAIAPSVVRGFDGMGREKTQAAASAEWTFDTGTWIRLSAGVQKNEANGRAEFMPDNSYIAKRVGNGVIYGGYLTHWWGPGWISALALSNNARPFPHIGYSRLDTKAFETPWLSWLGPWQAEFFAGVLEDRRIAKNTLYDGLRVTFNPLPGLEIGLARTDQACGTGHPCKPLTSYFNLTNDPNNPSPTNDEGEIDLRYSSMGFGHPFEIYTQLMNEDSNPTSHSVTSHLYGASAWFPIGERTARFTVEYADSVATLDIFSFGNLVYGQPYNNALYADGMHYRGRTLGFSLDSDSRLFSVQTSWIDSGGWTYTISYHHAEIAMAKGIAGGNAVSTGPVKLNLGEARIRVPWRHFTIDLAARLQDDQQRPGRGAEASVEAALTFRM